MSVHSPYDHMPPDPLRIDVLLTESAIAEQFRRSMDQRLLPELFFYWFPLSVRAWLRLCQDEQYRNYLRSDGLMRTSARAIVDDLTDRHIEVVSLGSGQGTKDLHLIEACLGADRRLVYRPVDAGQMLLEMACELAAARGVAAHGVKADLTNPSHLAVLKPDADTPARLVMLIGNTLGAFDPMVMLGRMRALLRKGDLLVIDGELGDDDVTRAGYEHPANRAFALAPLRSIGLTEADGDLVFESSHDVVPGLHRLEKHFRLRGDRTVQVAGEPLDLKAGERIHMNHSGKFERETLLSMLDGARLDVRGEYLSDDGRFLMIVAGPTP